MGRVDRGFNVAFAAALLSDAPRAGLCMGTALYSGNRLLSVGANRWHTHPDSDNTHGFDRTLHAEAVALLRRQHYDTRGNLTLYVARRCKDGNIGNSRPCVNCLRLCRLAGVTRAWFYEYGARKEITP
jgi:deoxycytidylate deaminase